MSLQQNDIIFEKVYGIIDRCTDNDRLLRELNELLSDSNVRHFDISIEHMPVKSILVQWVDSNNKTNSCISEID